MKKPPQKNKCQHKDKVYSSVGTTLACNPPINISYWICKDCGFEGQDSKVSHIDREYEETRARFGKNNITYDQKETTTKE